MRKHVMLSGGLGNQMFQYALYLSLKKKGIPAVLDTSEFLLNKAHYGFELKRVFSIQDECEEFCIPVRSLFYMFKRMVVNRNSFPERIFTYCEDVYHSQYKYLSGNWLSADYFSDIENELRRSFTFRNISEDNLIMSKELENVESVSIHIRCGDYFSHSRYCVCNDSYYKEAIQKISSYVKAPYFYVFSDDKEWSRNFMSKLGVPFKLVSWNNGLMSYQDMFLMSKCKHNIIANSTFSWWGAWLNNTPHKVVIAPSTWFTIRDVRIDYPGWELIKIKK